MSTRAREIKVLDYVLQNEIHDFKPVGSSYRLKDHSSLAVSEDGFFWHSQGKGFSGVTALDYLIKIRNYDFVSAVCHLIGERPLEKGEKSTRISQSTSKVCQQTSSEKVSSETKSKPKILKLPRRNKDNFTVISYLMNRGIDKDLILDCINRGVLYESSPYHNAVFLGKDENGKTKFACMRGTNGGFQCDAENSDKSFGFVIPPDNSESKVVAIFESPIDALSHKTLCNRGNLFELDCFRLSLGGTALKAIIGFLERQPQINHLIVATDNDEKGNLAYENIKTHFSNALIIERSLPSQGKDWNDTLKSILQQEKSQNKKTEVDYEIF